MIFANFEQKTFLAVATGIFIGFAIRRLIKRRKQLVLSKKDAVIITGCDSGIGYSIAHHCHNLGMTVFAGCLNPSSQGSLDLRTLENVHVVKLDVTEDESIAKATSTIQNILSENPNIVLRALVNNAGVMVFGEFAWQTRSLIEKQININLIGAMKVTKAFVSQIIQSKGRIINVCSPCSKVALPGLSVYAASKAGLLSWTDALRMELSKFHVKVVSFTPGSYPTETNIMSRQGEYAREMQEEMSHEDREFYNSYFSRYNAYLMNLGTSQRALIEDKQFYSVVEKALLRISPDPHYSILPLRHRFYHFLFKITPLFLRDILVTRFVNMPKWID